MLILGIPHSAVLSSQKHCWLLCSYLNTSLLAAVTPQSSGLTSRLWLQLSCLLMIPLFLANLKYWNAPDSRLPSLFSLLSMSYQSAMASKFVSIGLTSLLISRFID